MKEQFIPYEQALKLKELGFDEGCFSYYTIFGKFAGDISNPRKYNSEFEKGSYISAPLWQQAFDWFRTQHNLDTAMFIVPKHVRERMNDTIKYQVHICNDNENPCYIWSMSCITYEEARLACLNNLIEIVKQK